MISFSTQFFFTPKLAQRCMKSQGGSDTPAEQMLAKHPACLFLQVSVHELSRVCKISQLSLFLLR